MFSPSDAYKNNQDPQVHRYVGDGWRSFAPWCAGVVAGILAFTTSWMQAESKDLLPGYVMYPAIIGAISCALFGVSCIVGCLHKYNNYHDKHADQGANTLKHQTHPIAHWPARLIFGTGIAACLTEGSLLYMLFFLVADKETDYCVTWTPATSKTECSNGFVLIGLNTVLLAVLILAGGFYEHTVQEAVDYFQNRAGLHRARRLPNQNPNQNQNQNQYQGGGGGGGGGGAGYGYNDGDNYGQY